MGYNGELSTKKSAYEKISEVGLTFGFTCAKCPQPPMPAYRGKVDIPLDAVMAKYETIEFDDTCYDFICEDCYNKLED